MAINKARIEHWLKRGAKPSDSVRTLLAKHLSRDSVGCQPKRPRRSKCPGCQTIRVRSSPLRAVIEVVVRALVDHPDAVKVTESERRGMSVLELRTAPGDMGKIIGRQGRTAAALRTLLAVTAEKHGKRAQLDIKD